MLLIFVISNIKHQKAFLMSEITVLIMTYNLIMTDNHLIIKKLVEEFKWKFEWLGENTEK